MTREDLAVDFVDVLTGEGPFTVFAPTNAAFSALLDELGASSLAEIDPAILEAVLKMHVVSGKVLSGALTEGMTAPTLLGEEITFSLEGGAMIMDPNSRVSNITAVDPEAQNGVVHVIDTVILPKQQVTSVDDLKYLDVKIFPNPASNVLNIQTSEPFSEIRIVNLAGVSILSKISTSSNQRVDITGISPGVYVVILRDGEKRTTRKFVKR